MIPKHLEIAFKEFGVEEIPGEKHNPRILEYHSTCTLDAKDDETSWCSAFLNWVMMKANLKQTRSAMAISWQNVGVETNEPKIGDIVIFRRVDSSWRGHVGLFMGEKEGKILLFGGNQGNRVGLQWYSRRGKLLYLFQFRSIN
jgi:uncharacterized protein (TIGR02594 family)